MKKQMNIIKDMKQTRVTIPKEFVDELNITRNDKVEWEIKENKLKGKLIK